MGDATFTTANGMQWVAAFTDATERAAAETPGLCLQHLARRRPEDLVARWQRRLDQLGGLLWLAVEGQATARGIGPEAFARLFTAAHFPAAIVALLRAIAARHPHGLLAARMTLFDKIQTK